METFGCQMNVNDSEVWRQDKTRPFIYVTHSRAGGRSAPPLRAAVSEQVPSLAPQVVLAVLQDGGYALTEDVLEADVVLLNTCAIREKAEQRVWARLAYFRSLKRPSARGSKRMLPGRKAPVAQEELFGSKNAPLGQGVVVGVLGCMAERLKNQILEADRLADIVAGPDAYRDLPRLIDAVMGTGNKAMNVVLSTEETYADIVPVRPDGTKSAFVTSARPEASHPCAGTHRSLTHLAPVLCLARSAPLGLLHVSSQPTA